MYNCKRLRKSTRVKKQNKERLGYRMKAEKIESLCWKLLLALVVTVFVGLWEHKTYLSYKNGHNNTRLVSVWIPDGAKVVTPSEFNTEGAGITNKSDIMLANILTVHNPEQYQAMVTGQVVYTTFNLGLPGLIVKYRIKMGQVLVDHRRDYDVSLGAAKVKDLVYQGGQVKITTEFDDGTLCLLFFWYLIYSAFLAAVVGVVIFLILVWPIAKLVNMKQKKEWEEELAKRKAECKVATSVRGKC